MQVVPALHVQENAVLHVARRVLLAVAVVFYGFCALFTTPPAIGIKALAISLQKEPFIQECKQIGKTLPLDKTFSILSWNICCVGAGYSISDGGVVPWSFRVDRLAQAIAQQKADVVCLYETFDLHSALAMAEKLRKEGYDHLYYNIGPKAVGVSSGIFVASKYSIARPEFAPFSQEMLVGRTKHAAKGIFSFTLQSQGKDFARIHATHLQHSEIPGAPTKEEVHARKLEMQKMIEKTKELSARALCQVVTGDLNLDDEEYASSSWKSSFVKGDKYTKKTWGGDTFCANLMGKSVSKELNLDHTMIVKGSAKSLETTLVETGYDPLVFNSEALSDHEGLLTKVKVY
ncbi:MAG: hypothetical protein FJZ63_05375 [Chlamydiae bacterium]|nr:hypothetical protein [Chlamydiota bacterium]